jgi:5-(carboxyamino)imidazole ribonucleotide synthase
MTLQQKLNVCKCLISGNYKRKHLFLLPDMQLQFAGKDFKLGILGGGQLGRMLIQEAINLNISTAVLDPDPNAPCKYLTEHFECGNFRDEETVYQFGKKVNLLTIEIEHVNINALLRLESEGVMVYPQPQILAMVQDKGIQKEFFASHNIPTADFKLIHDKEHLKEFVDEFPAILKLRKGGYDGKGVMKVKSVDDLNEAFDAPCVLEKLVDFDCEIAVIVARNSAGEVVHYPPVDMEFNPDANLVEFLCSPARISEEIKDKAITIARKVIEKTGMTGILAVEMFVTKSGEVLVNEIAPRPHNSGHQTIEGNITSQYAQHLRAIMGLPLGDSSIIMPSVMINLLGEKGHTGEAHYDGIQDAMTNGGVYVHLYGKKETKPMRKMGHVTVLDKTIEAAIEKARLVQKQIKVLTR